ncbi:MAG TPA: biotin synthase BioB [Chthoniobacterales bacterium]|nr:biotin synthase BioB [Chthoniobacterales bacterium]
MKFDRLHALYHQPLFDLISQSREIHLDHWRGEEVQRCSLLSIKTGGCSEDCAYCAQSAHYSTGIEREDLLSVQEIVDVAKRARAQGATRFCMGAAWRGVRDGTEKFEQVLETVRNVSQLGMEVCVTLGQIGPAEAHKLRAAGVTAYNHNIDTSPEFYPEIVSTHTFTDRLNTIAAVQKSGMSVCSGGIIGMGESTDDRLRMIEVLSELDPAPESVPINCLMAMPGTPLADQPPIDIFDLVRLVAVTRIALPKARVRLAAGRTRISREGQALCFFAGANSIFFGDKLLTAKNPEVDVDLTLLRELGLNLESIFRTTSATDTTERDAVISVRD